MNFYNDTFTLGSRTISLQGLANVVLAQYFQAHNSNNQTITQLVANSKFITHLIALPAGKISESLLDWNNLGNRQALAQTVLGVKEKVKASPAIHVVAQPAQPASPPPTPSPPAQDHEVARKSAAERAAKFTEAELDRRLQNEEEERTRIADADKIRKLDADALRDKKKKKAAASAEQPAEKVALLETFYKRSDVLDAINNAFTSRPLTPVAIAQFKHAALYNIQIMTRTVCELRKLHTPVLTGAYKALLDFSNSAQFRGPHLKPSRALNYVGVLAHNIKNLVLRQLDIVTESDVKKLATSRPFTELYLQMRNTGPNDYPLDLLLAFMDSASKELASWNVRSAEDLDNIFLREAVTGIVANLLIIDEYLFRNKFEYRRYFSAFDMFKDGNLYTDHSIIATDERLEELNLNLLVIVRECNRLHNNTKDRLEIILQDGYVFGDAEPTAAPLLADEKNLPAFAIADPDPAPEAAASGSSVSSTAPASTPARTSFEQAWRAHYANIWGEDIAEELFPSSR